MPKKKYVLALNLPYRKDYYVKGSKSATDSISVWHQYDFKSKQHSNIWEVNRRKYSKKKGGYWQKLKKFGSKESADAYAKKLTGYGKKKR